MMTDEAARRAVRNRFGSEIPNVMTVVRELKLGYQQSLRILETEQPEFPAVAATALHLPEVPVIEWPRRLCYGQEWKGYVHNDSFKHPAKFSRRLIYKILRHGLEQGYWKHGDLLGDPFGGVGLGGLAAADCGLRWIGNELEAPFYQTAHLNFAMHKPRWERMGRPLPQITLGDSRFFDRIVAAALTSPPYANSDQNYAQGGKSLKYDRGARVGMKNDQLNKAAYENSEGNVAHLPAGSLEGAVTSPPYDTINAGAGGLNHKPPRPGTEDDTGRTPSPAQTEVDDRYGDTPGQIAKLGKSELEAVVTSPPFLDSRSGTTAAKKTKGGGPCAARLESVQAGHRYGDSDGQITDLKPGDVDAAISSPPYADTMSPAAGGPDTAHPDGAKRVGHGVKERCGSTEGNIANLKTEVIDSMLQGNGSSHKARTDAGGSKKPKETYWAAMRLCYEALFRCIRPGGFCCVVVKDYVRKGKRVPLCDDTMRLLTFIGFEPVERIRALLTEKLEHHRDMLTGAVAKGEQAQKESKSFFRRVHEAKPGAVRIDWEEVLICRKPELA